jgi:hypothetical protein
MKNKNHLRFYIVSRDTSEAVWSEIKDFIEDIECLRGGSKDMDVRLNFQHLEISSHFGTKEEIKQFRKQLTKNFAKEVKREFLLTDKGKSKLKFYRFIDFVIVLKLTERPIDFKHLLPFFLILEKHRGASLGIDFNGIPNKETRSHMLFSIGQFLWKWKTVKNSYNELVVFSILDEEFDDKRSGEHVKIETAALPTQKDVVLRRYSPLIEINKELFDQLFVNTLFKTIARPGLINGSDNPLSYLKVENFNIEKFNVDIKNLFVRRYIDFKTKIDLHKHKEKVDLDFTPVEDLLFENFKNEPFIAFYIFCMVLDQLMLERSRTKTRGQRWVKALKELVNEHKILNYIVLIRKYVTGLREVAENIIFHTEAKRGYFYFVLKPSDHYSPDLKSKKSTLRDQKKYKDLYFKMLEEKFIEKEMPFPGRFLEVVLMDMSEVGIIRTYKSDFYAERKERGMNEEEKTKIDSLELEDFYVGKFSRFPDQSHLDMRYLAQLGLKTFASVIKNKRGYFEVETNQEKGKRRLVYFRNIKSVEENGMRWFGRDVDRTIGDGTYYDILLPISEDLIKGEEEARTTFEVKSFIELFEEWLHSGKEPKITDFTSFESFSSYAYDKKQDFVEKIGKKIVHHYQNEKKSSVLSVDFERVQKNSIDFSTFIKILTYVQLAHQINCIIIYNLNKISFNQMMNQLKILAEFGKFWNNHSWVYLYDENGVPYIITGENAAACDNLNKSVELHYGYCYSILEDADDSEDLDEPESSDGASQTDPIKHNILPYELLIRTTDRGKIPVTLFEKNVYCILEKEIEKRDFGVKIKDAHMRLGSKIHLDNFFEAEVLFHDNFYVERFAYLVSRNILISRRGKNKIFLIGYGSYSEMFLNRTKHILNYEAQSKADSRDLGICPAYFICNDVEELKWQGLERLKDLNTAKEYDFALVVSVASSLTTNYKIIKNFEREVSKIVKKHNFFQKEKLIFNASIILIRDKNEDDPTDKEKSYKWRKIDFINKTIKTDNFEKPIKFYVCEEGGWNSPINCSRCFPDLYGNGQLIDEKILLETGKASINPKLVLGWPKVEADDTLYENEKKRIRRFMNCIKYGHIERNTNHHLYYFDTLKYFETPRNRHEIRSWLEGIKPKILGEVDSYNIIVSILHHSNTGFINLVNDTIFNGAATIIILDIDQEFRDNVITKYSYLKDLKGKIKFHFVDDGILTGEKFIMARSFVTSIFEEFDAFKGTKTDVEIFSSIIVLLNRLSVYRKKDFLQIRIKFENHEKGESKQSTIFKPYVTLFVPPIRDPESFCFICGSQEMYQRLSEYSVMDRLKSHFNEKVKSLEIKTEYQRDYAEQRIYFRLRLTHLVYYLLSKNRLQTDESYKKVIKKIWEHKGDIAYKIDVIKVFSSPLLSYYKNIEDYVFSKMVMELDQLIDKPKEAIKMLDFNLLVTLMKQLTQLQSNFIIRKKNIERIWRFYAKYKSKYNLLYDGLYEGTKSRKYLQLVAQLLKFEKKTEEISPEDYPLDDPQVIKNRIKELETSIKEISGKDISPVKHRLSALLDSLKITDPQLCAKTVCNLAEFVFAYVTMVKMLVYTNEAKCLWLEHLLRTGREFPQIVDFSAFESIDANVPYNDLYKRFDDDDPSSTIINRNFKDFFVMAKLENVTILQRVLIKFAEENYHGELKEKIRKKGFKINGVNTKNEYQDFLDKIKSEYYYEYLRRFVSGSGPDTYKKVFDVYLLKTYIELLMEADIKEDLTIEDAIGQITQKAVEIMEANKGFFTIKKFRTKEKNLYTIGRHNISATEVPFELTEDYNTFQEINNEKLWYTFFSPRLAEWKGKEKEIANGIIVIRFFHSKSLITKDFNSIGGFTFLYEEEYSEGQKGQREEDVKRAQNKENIRYIMLVKDVLRPFLEKNFDNDNLNNWIETKKRDMFSTEYFRKIYHGAHRDIKILRDEITNGQKPTATLGERAKKIDNARAYSWIVDAQVSIGHLYAKYTLKELDDEIDTNQGPFDVCTSIFNRKFRDILRILGEYKNFDIDFELSSGVKTNILDKHLRLFVIEIFSNYMEKKYHDKGNVIIGIDDFENLFIETRGSSIKITEDELRKSINSDRPISSGIGLFTINKSINRYCRKNIGLELEPSEKMFKVTIPVVEEVIL